MWHFLRVRDRDNRPGGGDPGNDRSPRLRRAGGPAIFPGVDLANYLRMDPHLLVGLLNTELRNNCESLDDLVKTHHLDAGSLVDKMARAGYDYRPEQKQFR